jgi:flagellin
VVSVGDKSLQQRLERALSQHRKEGADAMEKLASGSIFTTLNPRPSERSIAEGLSQKVRGLTAAKRNINDAVSLLQTADSSMQQINDMIIRMKEINIAATNTTINDRDRKFLFIEYQALHDEIKRIADTTTFNGVPVLNGDAPQAPERLVFRVGDPVFSEFASDDEDINTIVFEGLRDVVATPSGLGLMSASDLLSNFDAESGISIDDARDLMQPSADGFASSYDQALTALSTMRSIYGGMQARMQHAINYTEVLSENLSAARSSIADTDYAAEVSRLTSSRILMQAGTAVLAQSGFSGGLSLTLLDGLFK